MNFLFLLDSCFCRSEPRRSSKLYFLALDSSWHLGCGLVSGATTTFYSSIVFQYSQWQGETNYLWDVANGALRTHTRIQLLCGTRDEFVEGGRFPLKSRRQEIRAQGSGNDIPGDERTRPEVESANHTGCVYREGHELSSRFVHSVLGRRNLRSILVHPEPSFIAPSTKHQVSVNSKPSQFGTSITSITN